MTKHLMFVAAAVVLTACASDSEKARQLAKDADLAFASAKLSSARDGYNQAFALDSTNTHAAFGAGLTELLLVADSQPVKDVLDVCGQPLFDVENRIFGDAGLLGQDTLVRPGAGSVTILSRASSTDTFHDTGYTPEHYRSYRDTDYVNLRLSDVAVGSSNSPGTIYLWLNATDLYASDSVATPLVDGTVIDLTKVSYPLWVWLDNGYYAYSSNPTGTITFTGGSKVGDNFTLTFNDVKLQVCTYGRYASNDCTGEYLISGSITDSMSKPFRLDAKTLPFGEAREEVGPPHRSSLISALDMCGPALTTDLLAAKAGELSTVFDGIAHRFDAAASAGLDKISFVVPKSLLHTDQDLLFNGTDLLALRGFSHLASSALKLVSNYRYLDGSVTALVGQFEYWYDDYSVYPYTIKSRSERGIVASRIVDNLNSTFLARIAGYDLEPAKQQLDLALQDAVAALLNRPGQPGVLDFQQPRSRAWALQLADQIENVRQSLHSATPLEVLRNEALKVHLKAFFDLPLDRDRALQLNGNNPLFRLILGSPDATYASGRNDSYSTNISSPTWDSQFDWVNRAVYQENKYDVACTGTADTTTCGAGWVCRGRTSYTYGHCRDTSGTDQYDYSCTKPEHCPTDWTCPTGSETTSYYCSMKSFSLTEAGLWEGVVSSDWPAFVAPGAHLLFDSWQ